MANTLTATKVLTGAVVILATALFFSIRSCNRAEDSHDELAGMLKAQRDTTTYFKNKFGQEVATRSEMQGSIDNLKAVIGADSLKRLAERFDTKPERITGYTQVATRTEAEIKPSGEAKVVYRDTGSTRACPEVKYMEQPFKNPYYTALARVGEGAFLRLQTFDTLTIVRKDTLTGLWPFRKAITRVNVLSANPASQNKILGAYTALNPAQSSFLTISGDAGYISTPGLSAPYYGGSVSYQTGRVTVTGLYGRLAGSGSGTLVQVQGKLRIMRL